MGQPTNPTFYPLTGKPANPPQSEMSYVFQPISFSWSTSVCLTYGDLKVDLVWSTFPPLL